MNHVDKYGNSLAIGDFVFYEDAWFGTGVGVIESFKVVGVETEAWITFKTFSPKAIA